MIHSAVGLMLGPLRHRHEKYECPKTGFVSGDLIMVDFLEDLSLASAVN